MTKQLTVDEILDSIEVSDKGVYECSGGHSLDEYTLKKAKQALKALVTEMVNEIIGDDDDSVRNPSTGELDIHSVWRNNFRAEQRKRAKLAEWLGEEEKK